MQTEQLRNPYVLIVLDGFGYSEEKEHNAIYAAETPVWDSLWSQHPHTLLHASDNFVGLPDGQMGNSEVGHMHLGCGRTVYQDFTRILKAISDNTFQQNEVLLSAIQQAKQNNRCLHIMGLLSPGGVHSHEDHLIAMIRMAVAQGCQRVALHAFLDGRDTPPKSAKESLLKVQAVLDELGVGQIASISGRYYAMDRDQRWERIEPVYELLTRGQARYTANSAVEALEAAYARDESDEFVSPTLIQPHPIAPEDPVIFMNFRADRARQLSKKLVENGYNLFTLTQYDDDLPVPVAFPPQTLSNGLGEYLSSLGKTQLRIAETEKYAHVTFFFNGGTEAPFAGEERILVPSPKVATYDLQPEMSAPELTDKLVAAIRSRKFDAIVCNYANADMVGHTGDFAAAIKAVEVLDSSLGRILAALRETNGHCLITSDHGNVEKMFDAENQQVHTAHTRGLVPLVYAGDLSGLAFVEGPGTLADVAPTLLELMALPKPVEMTGQSLLVHKPL